MTVSTPAHADTHGDAVKAFEEGRRLREADPERAVQAFERSIKLEPSIGAYYNLGQVFETMGRLRDALDAFRKSEKLALQKGDPRNKDAQEAWGKLLETHNYVVLNMSDEVKTASGLTVVVDGAPAPESQYNGEVFRAPTIHTVVVSATGRKDLRLDGLPNKQPVNVMLGAVANDQSTTQPPPPPQSRAPTSFGRGGWQKWTGVGLVAVGVGGLAYSLLSYVGYRNRESSLADARANAAMGCAGTPEHVSSCTPDDPAATRVAAGNAAIRAYDENEHDAKTSAPLWVGAAVVGLAAAVTGVVLFANAPSGGSEPAPSAARARVDVHVVPRIGLHDVHDSGLSVVGTF